MSECPSFTDLETRGFVVVRRFLAAAELQLLRDDFAQVSLDDNLNYNARTPSAAAMERLRPQVEAVLREVNRQTALRVDLPVPATSNYFATGAVAGVHFPFHQDHESYFIVQNHYDYLNFYVPIVKPDVRRSNLSVVPFDVLRREAPRAHDFLVRGGAGTFRPLGGRWLAVNDDRAAMRLIARDLDAMVETPHLAAGDLLLMRGDIVHRTQDSATERVALSWRAADGSTVIRRSRLAAGGVRKAVMMCNHTLPYQRLFRAFDVAGTDELRLTELLDVYERTEPPSPVDRRTFLRQLLAEKRRAGVLTRFVADVPVAVGFRALDRFERFERRARRAA